MEKDADMMKKKGEGMHRGGGEEGKGKGRTDGRMRCRSGGWRRRVVDA